MLKGHVYPVRTSVRSPHYKRECFESALKQVLHTDFEGGQPVATPHGNLHRPARRVMRDMAWTRARKDAADQRAELHPAIKS